MKNKVLPDVSMILNLLHRHCGTLDRCSNFSVPVSIISVKNNGLSFRTWLQNCDRAADWSIWGYSFLVVLSDSLNSGVSYYWDTKDDFQVFCDELWGRHNRSVNCCCPKITRSSVLATALTCVHLPMLPADPRLSHFVTYNGCS